MRYNLKQNPVLTDYQVQILRLFFAETFARGFFLTGGTALSAFYLAHRESQDLDLFTIEDFDTKRLDLVVREIARQLECRVLTKVSSPTYNEFYLENEQGGWTQRLDFVREQPVRFGELEIVEGVRVDALENIGSNKIAAMLGRLEVKDYIDLYMITQGTEWDFDRLWPLAKQKDLGLNEFTLASCVAEVRNIGAWPKMFKALDKNDFYEFYETLVRNLLEKARPEDK